MKFNTEPVECPNCSEQVLGIVRTTFRHVPITWDGYHGPDGKYVETELVKAYCPECDVEVFIDWGDEAVSTVDLPPRGRA